jgi:hypothetical protein
MAINDKDGLETLGRVYASVLQLQLAIDLFVVIFLVLLWTWPKGAAVAIAAFREGIRQPMFWLFLAGGLLIMGVAVLLPFYTFGEDLRMMIEIDYDIIMALAVIFAVFTASISISEEIEGRTAITLMSKPLSRRQFLLGKYIGILLAGLLMTLLLGWLFNWAIYGKRWFDKMDVLATDREPIPVQLTAFLDAYVPAGVATDFVRGAGMWLFKTQSLVPGLMLGFGQLMVLLAIAVSLATRLPMILNVPICLLLYFLGHLTPVLTDIARRYQAEAGGSAVAQMLSFMAQLFNALLPNLEYLGPNMAPIAGYVMVYCVLFTVIVLLFGLILFEDRDLA